MSHFRVAEEAFHKRRFVEALEALIPELYGEHAAPAEALVLRDRIFEELQEAMRTATHRPRNRMKFGTSGWRGLLHDDFSTRNVACVTRGLIEVLLRPESHAKLGVRDEAELRERGCIIAHDTRIMGPDFAECAARVLLAAGVRVIHIGMATTPEVSTAIAETHAAFSINFTPSHNPFSYHGYKFNPADGGPATQELTEPVATRANELLEDPQCEVPSLSDEEWEAARADPARFRSEDPIALYKNSIAKRIPWLRLDALVEAINEGDIEIFVDNGFGATRGKYEALLEGLAPGKLFVANGGEDWLFGGKSREPSVENFRSLQESMAASKARLVVGFMNDGDGDRFVGGGREGALVMNEYGPMVVRYLVREHGLSGDVTRSVMTSHMADAARATYLPEGKLHETAVGFQYLKGSIPTSVNSWEESDGMSPQGWSLDKDGLMAALLLTSMVIHHDETPEALLAATQAELGSFFFERRKVQGGLQGDALSKALRKHFSKYAVGSAIEIDGRSFRIADTRTIDGLKLVFEGGWWLGMRASGTEPVARPYVETFTRPGANADEIADAKSWQAKLMTWLEAELATAMAIEPRPG